MKSSEILFMGMFNCLEIVCIVHFLQELGELSFQHIHLNTYMIM